MKMSKECLMNRKVSVSVLVATLVLMSLASPAMAASDEVLVLHFDEGSGSIVRDLSGNGNDGTIYGATWVDGISGKALRFDGVDDYVDCGTDSSLNLGNEFTIMAWVKSENNKYQAIAGKHHEDSGAYSGYGLKKTTSTSCGSEVGDNKFSLRVDGGGWNYEYTHSDVGYTDTNWHFVVGVRRGGTNYLYVDGEQQADTGSQSLSNTGDPFFIGAGTSPRSSNYANFNGIIDEVSIYNRALSADEIRALYEGKKPEITMTKSASPSTIQEGETVTISVRVDNTGTGDAKTVEVTDTIPLGFKIISGSKSESFGEIKSGDYRTFEYILKATGSGKFTCDPATATYTDADGKSYSAASNAMSLQVGGEVPVGADSDGDGWSDEKEQEMGTNPYSVDSDSDGLRDPEDPNPTVQEKKKGIPGFEAVFAIAGLLAVAYLVRRRKR
jgi:PGF-CTERM protein/uncharacterized repeat protein (TIGR01451 family)